jgi:hypothetical protein
MEGIGDRHAAFERDRGPDPAAELRDQHRAAGEVGAVALRHAAQLRGVRGTGGPNHDLIGHDLIGPGAHAGARRS